MNPYIYITVVAFLFIVSALSLALNIHLVDKKSKKEKK